MYRTSSLAALALAAFAGAALAQSAPIGSTKSMNCLKNREAWTCTENWRDLPRGDLWRPRSKQELAEAAARDKKWFARCRPAVRQDRYGVRRYVYAARDCEYGRYE